MQQAIITFKTGLVMDWTAPLGPKDVEMKPNMVTAIKDGKQYSYYLRDLKSVEVIDTERPEKPPVILYPKGKI